MMESSLKTSKRLINIVHERESLNMDAITSHRVACQVRLVEGAGSKLHATAHAAALATLQRAGLTRLPAVVTALYCGMNDDRKFARDVGARPTPAQS